MVVMGTTRRDRQITLSRLGYSWKPFGDTASNHTQHKRTDHFEDRKWPSEKRHADQNRIDTGLRRTYQKPNRCSITRTIVLEPNPCRHNTTRAQRQRNTKRDRLKDSRKSLKPSTDKSSGQHHMQQARQQHAKQQPRSQLAQHIPTNGNERYHLKTQQRFSIRSALFLNTEHFFLNTFFYTS